MKTLNIFTFLQTIFMFWSPFYLISRKFHSVEMYFAGVIIFRIVFGAYFSRYYWCVLLFCQPKIKTRSNLRFLSLQRNFLKTFSPPFLINKTMKSYMTKRCTKYDTGNSETKKTQFYKLSYNGKYTKSIKNLTNICGLFCKKADSKSFFILFSESVLN